MVQNVTGLVLLNEVVHTDYDSDRHRRFQYMFGVIIKEKDCHNLTDLSPQKSHSSKMKN